MGKLAISILFILMLNVSCTEKHSSDAATTLWKFEAARDEIAPDHWVDQEKRREGTATLVLSGRGKDYVNGCWYLEVDVNPGTFYEFQTCFMQTEVDEPDRSILARIVWMGNDGTRINQPEYPVTLREQTVDGWNIIQQSYEVPEGAVRAKLELVYRWDDDGTVYFSEASLKEVQAVEARMLTLAAIHFRPVDTGSASENLKLFADYIKEAADKNADIVCLPEAINMAGTGNSYADASEPIPGPSTEFLGEIARQNQISIVAGLLERSGPEVYNAAVLIDQKGKLVGKYRKVSLPREEIEGGISPGKSYPVFDMEFGRIGMMICWDVQFPEVARQLALKGAEIIFMPIWGGNITLAKARAIENQIYLVSSSYSMRSGVFDMEGELIVEASEQHPVAVVQVDLNKHLYWPWLGDLKNRIPREKPGPEKGAQSP